MRGDRIWTHKDSETAAGTTEPPAEIVPHHEWSGTNLRFTDQNGDVGGWVNLRGARGATGARGSTGATGAKGNTGATGPAGGDAHVRIHKLVSTSGSTHFTIPTHGGYISLYTLATGGIYFLPSSSLGSCDLVGTHDGNLRTLRCTTSSWSPISSSWGRKANHYFDVMVHNNPHSFNIRGWSYSNSDYVDIEITRIY